MKNKGNASQRDVHMFGALTVQRRCRKWHSEQGVQVSGGEEKGITEKEINGEKRLNWERIKWGHREVSGSWRKVLRLD